MSSQLPRGQVSGPAANPRRRKILLAVAAGLTALVAAIVAVAVVLSAPGSQEGDATETAAPDDTQASPFERPADWSPYRPAVHITPERHWMNDPQKPFFLDGLWHYYYLYNADYPEGNGTEWFHATSTDLVHWTDQGVAIEKYTTGLGDIWTGTAVVDHDNTAGFGEDAVIALVTQQSDGVQRQSLFISRDGGYRFEPYQQNPVMENPGVADWRDPRVFWDERAGRWVMALAEHDRIGFYTSPDLINWTYRSDFPTAGLGILECPDMFPMAVDGDPEDIRWVLMAGANGEAEGKTTGTVYWTGTWDGETFSPDTSGHRWLDHGPDYYASVTWDDPRLPKEERLAQRYGIGWLNNWAYAGDLPPEEWRGGTHSIVRSIRLSAAGDSVQLQSVPAPQLQALEGTPERVGQLTVDAGGVNITPPTTGAYRLRLDATEAAGDGTGVSDRGELRVNVNVGGGHFATVGYDFANQVAFIARDADAIAAGMPDVYRRVSSAAVAPQAGRVHLDIIVDASSVEMFVNDGEAALSMATYGVPNARGVVFAAPRGEIELSDVTLTPLRVAPVVRAAEG